MTLEEALQKLDPTDSSQWTADGLPLIDKVKELTGDDSITRALINKDHATFTRDNPTLELGDPPAPSGATAQGATTSPVGGDEVLGDKDKGVVGVDPDIEVAEPGDQMDADGTVTASSENTRNEGRADQPLEHVDADGGETASRENQELIDNVDIPAPLDVDGSVTSNRQVNDEDASRDAGQAPDQTDELVGQLERTNPDDASAEDEQEIASLDAEVEAMEADLSKVDEEINKMRREADAKRAQRDALIERRDRAVDPHRDQRERMAFIAQQTAQRAARAGDTRVARELLLSARGITGSPLDQALAERPRQVRSVPT